MNFNWCNSSMMENIEICSKKADVVIDGTTTYENLTIYYGLFPPTKRYYYYVNIENVNCVIAVNGAKEEIRGFTNYVKSISIDQLTQQVKCTYNKRCNNQFCIYVHTVEQEKTNKLMEETMTKLEYVSGQENIIVRQIVTFHRNRSPQTPQIMSPQTPQIMSPPAPVTMRSSVSSTMSSSTSVTSPATTMSATPSPTANRNIISAVPIEVIKEDFEQHKRDYNEINTTLALGHMHAYQIIEGLLKSIEHGIHSKYHWMTELINLRLILDRQDAYISHSNAAILNRTASRIGESMSPISDGQLITLIPDAPPILYDEEERKKIFAAHADFISETPDE